MDGCRRLYEKRKTAALEIEQQMKDMFHTGDMAGIEAVLNLLITDFATSTQPNYRKGGLIGLAATAVGLAQMASSDYLKKLVPPVRPGAASGDVAASGSSAPSMEHHVLCL